MKIVFFSVTGQTRRFVSKLNLSNVEITPTNPFFAVNEPYILVVPTYEKEITEFVEDFLNYSVNRQNLLGVAGTGNRNFAELFIFTAKDIAHDYQVPLVYSFEFSGTPKDVENFKKVVNEIDIKTTR
ncbi:class Ib ribonucleoside-diphosphate reductase assembly flavoprotein NrdI [Liquorilactobacillus hordei]|uniref:Ribonucleotide reductase stimulatory protein n=1 Tax=Liquorilactobacillus hordei DSM 19519 TaxID=1423759 RepID=A0A0R1MEG8_9LACO|nr:class Ib ribonucleoside-diphosphate reductase assembly flavoprotein NrdI [Liquorilactobacillus hordei]KRL06551.1 ribonucleotide reductase stimulatory protein [Liquorilactobacillus hordei DSM 19519]QYH51943.1 class Ib ribonucleoside-diphosphate reductase assembly flavoprotein NrdI [Liquorilactobacillus hordei DSM 19519]